jgi:hypothetical protein
VADVMSPSAAVVSADLADAALETTTLTRARKLARWLGPGRELTSRGMLRSAAAAEACWALGISPPGARPPSALDVDELMEDWTAAVDAGSSSSTAAARGPPTPWWRRPTWKPR